MWCSGFKGTLKCRALMSVKPTCDVGREANVNKVCMYTLNEQVVACRCRETTAFQYIQHVSMGNHVFRQPRGVLEDGLLTSVSRALPLYASSSCNVHSHAADLRQDTGQAHRGAPTNDARHKGAQHKKLGRVRLAGGALCDVLPHTRALNLNPNHKP